MTGKASFDHVYAEPDPRPYFRALRALDYHLPQLAKPYFAKLVAEYRAERGVAEPTVVDVGCSYGVNGALRRAEATMDQLYDHYTGTEAAGLDRDGLIERDRRLVRGAGGVRFVGLDVSGPALAYARDAGFLDEAVHADLERNEPTDAQTAVLAGADLVVSTGCVGYVTERTVGQLAALPGRRPWMAHFVLRMFSYAPVADALTGLGYATTETAGVFRQRRFASADERERILDTLRDNGVEPHELETAGWLCARLYLSRPTDHEEHT
ncbi:class I SAM-dependent methyltransferase [Actinophytocola gossypii]|uniref:Class I SAM-dependent methyltransferase n=1 Tax=Actinophytocola gossypii TaxID=2812003 RepID=A0ABT2J0V4_9PSEU|nr:class I SAM-dependent methyltransferase [Actinophytocola gossypii]MCT2581504.1 class I SAM-dependent methyltransferase [Actinophytocola gossypii]